MFTTIGGVKIEDFYTHLIKLIDSNQVDDAIIMVMNLTSQFEKLQIVSRLANTTSSDLFVTNRMLALAHTLDIALVLARDINIDFVLASDFEVDVEKAIILEHDIDFVRALTHDLVLALVLAYDIAFVLARDLDRDLYLVRDRDRDLALAHKRARAKALNQVILRILEDDLLKDNSYSKTATIRLETKNIATARQGQIIFEGLKDLTPRNLSDVVAPYLQAIFDFEKVIADVNNSPFIEPKIQSISLNSPLSIQLPGVGETINALRDLIVPWRRKNAKKLADLNEARAEAEILDLRSKTAHGRVEIKIKEEEVEQRKLETERLRLELEEKRLDIEKRKLEIEREKIELAISVIDRFAPEMLERERITYVTRLLQPLNILIESPLELQD